MWSFLATGLLECVLACACAYQSFCVYARAGGRCRPDADSHARYSLGSTEEVVAGAGCYTAGTSVYASVLGTVEMSAAPEGHSAAVQLVQVRRKKAGPDSAAPVLPQIGSIVIAKVCRAVSCFSVMLSRAAARSWTSRLTQACLLWLGVPQVANINPKNARVNILSVDGTPVSEAFPAMIRSEDVRRSTIDDVQMSACFRPGDYVRCSVISLGSRRDYVLSTARDDLGVVYASLDGMQLAAIDSGSMICPKTLTKEPRKVAITAPR